MVVAGRLMRGSRRASRRRWAGLEGVLALVWLACGLVPRQGAAQCIDEAIRDELNARRRYRGVHERLFQKAGRHELSALGGLYGADLFSSHWTAGGAYTFHVSEGLALEASFLYTRSRSEIVRILERDRAATLVRVDTPVYIYGASLLWELAYGKMRWFGGAISRFSFYLSAGGGITDNQSARGLTFSGGLGMKFYAGKWFAVRFDVRDHLLRQELLGESTLVNNLVATMGTSIFLPFGF